jgi:hypothetical protein
VGTNEPIELQILPNPRGHCISAMKRKIFSHRSQEVTAAPALVAEGYILFDPGFTFSDDHEPLLKTFMKYCVEQFWRKQYMYITDYFNSFQK